MTRRMLAILGLLATTFALTATADQRTAKKDDKAPKSDRATVDTKDRALLHQQLLKQRFEEFKKQLRFVKDKLDKGSTDDKAKAKALDNALKEIERKRLDADFTDLVKILAVSKLGSVQEAKEALAKSKKLAEEIRALIDILREDSKAAKDREARKRLEEMIKELEGIIKGQKLARALLERKITKDELARIQKRVTIKTENLQRALEGKPPLKDDKGGEAKKTDDKGKDKGKGKSGEGKEGNGKPKGPDKGESKKADPKAKQKPEGDNKAKGKSGEGKADAKAAQGKQGEKAGQGKGAGKPEANAAKGGGKGKGKGEGESKPKGKGEGEGEGKGKGKPSESKGGGKSGGKSGDKSDSGDQADQPDKSGAQPPQEDTVDARKKIQEGNKYQKDAQAKIEDDKKKMAGKDQEIAIQKLEEAKKKLEELLRQAREEELERLLTALENRCREMLELQRLVKAATVAIDKTVLTNKDKKPDRANMIESGKQAEKEKRIVDLASKAIEMIQAEGTALAFDEVFQQVQTDMKKVQGYLEETKVGSVTQIIEQDIIDQLEEMIKALQKAKQELGQSKPGQPKDSPPPDPKLLDDIAQLKMIRSMQVRVNSRTKMYHKQFDPKEPEQTSNKDLKDEILELSGRQDKLFDVTMKIAKGDNK